MSHARSSLPPAATCPDWPRLAAARDASPADPPGWEDAVRHLDGCPHCRRTAIAADPLLAFRRMAPPPLAADEAEAMRLRVAALRGATRLAPTRLALSFRHVAAAAVVTLAVLAGGNVPQQSPIPAAAPPIAAAPALDPALASEPLLDGLDQPYEHVVQWNGDDLSVVLVVDGRLGV